MKRMKLRLAVLCAALVLLAGCRGKEEIRIGVNMELSGLLTQYGTACYEGIRLAVREQNAEGGLLGKQIKLCIADNRSQNYDSALCAQRLIQVDHCAAIIGPSTSGGVKSELLSDPIVPIIAPSATSDDLLPQGKETNNLFRICYTDTAQGIAMAKYADALGSKRIVIFTDGASDYSRGISNVFEEHFEWLGGKIIGREYYIAGDEDFSAQLLKWKDQNPDAIYLPGYYVQAGMIIRQAREMGITCRFYSGDSFDSAALDELAGGKENLYGIYFTNHYAPGEQALETFADIYQKEYGTYPGSYSALGYDAAKLIFEAIRQAGSDDPQKIATALREMDRYHGVTGSFYFDKDQNAVKKVELNAIDYGVRRAVEVEGVVWNHYSIS